MTDTFDSHLQGGYEKLIKKIIRQGYIPLQGRTKGTCASYSARDPRVCTPRLVI